MIDRGRVGALRVIGGAVLGLVALAALALLLPSLKEGYGREELGQFAAIAIGLAVLAAGWWLLNREGHRGAAATGVALLAVPLLIYAGLAAQIAVNGWRARRLARTVRVAAIRQTDLRWPGIAEPVGVRVEIELDQAVGLVGNLFAPKVVMGVDPRPTADDYFSIQYREGPVLTVPLLDLEAQPPRDVLARPGPTRLVYDLLPSTVSRRDGEMVCLETAFAEASPRASRQGSHLGASWLFAAPGGIIVDLSAPLTDALRRMSALEGRPAAWDAMMRAVSPDRLSLAGYQPCASSRPGVRGRCVCRPA